MYEIGVVSQVREHAHFAVIRILNNHTAAAIDNLVKGAAGQAVQNMNLMIGAHEGCGLMPAPHPL